MSAETYRDVGASVDERVADLLGRMTLDEKVAQLGAIWVTQLVSENAFHDATTRDLLAHGIGQITRIGASTGLLAEDSATLINQIQRIAVEHTRLGIPVLLHEEAVGGFTHRGATTFPQALGLACTWDPALIGEVAEVIRHQMLAVGARLALSPVLDVARDPRWGRVEETYGESPELCARLGVAYVTAMQTTDLSKGVACAAKHFLGYAASMGGRNQAPVHLGGRELRDVYAMPFAAAIRDAALDGIMNSYSSVDGLPCAGSREVLTDLLRDELGFDGVVVADYFAVSQLLDNHHTAADRAEAAAQALRAGLDVELPSLDCYRELPGLVRDGRLSEATIDLAVERVLAQKLRLGLFERPYVEPGRAAAVFDTAGQRDLARRVAAKSVCLLANDGVLPLRPSELRYVAVIGPHADDPRLLQGDYHYPAHLEIMYTNAWAEMPAIEGLPTPTASPEPDRAGAASDGGSSFASGPYFTPHVTPLAGLRGVLAPDVTVQYARGCHDSDPTDEAIGEAVDLATVADVAIVFVGGKSGLVSDCTVGEMRDAASLDLPGAQTDLVEAVSATGTPTIVVVISGRVHTMGRIADAANALLWSPPPGEEGGSAIAEVLTGAVDPSGRLPVTLPRHVGQLPLHHDMRARGERSEIYGDYVDCASSPLFAFGHGLSYTRFEYGSLRAEPGTTASRTTIEIEIINTGDAAGEEVVQLYCRDDVASVARPNRELVGFARVALAPGESAAVTFDVPSSRLAFHDAAMRRVTEPGTFTFLVGASSIDIRAEATVELSGDTVVHPVRDSEMTSSRVTRVMMTWELRWHPFRGEWVLFTAHRGARPWIGETVEDDEPEVPDDNALAPLGRRINTTNPDYRGVFVFTNDLPVFGPDAPEPVDGDDLYRVRRAVGTAEVVCYHHDPTRSMADLTDDEVAAVVRTWRDRTAALQALDGVAHVLIFENRGAAVGTSNPHPHCQIYAGALVYGIADREADVATAHFMATGRELLADVVERESSGGRVLDGNHHFFACVPWFARYAYEVLVLPRRPMASLVDLDDNGCRALGIVLRDVVRRYDALWGLRMPYVLAVHQAPVGDHPHYPFHVELHPPLRAPGLLKYLAGPEIGGGSMTNESDPDEKAAELRDALS